MKRINNQVFIIVCCFMFFSLARIALRSRGDAAPQAAGGDHVAVGIDGGAMAGARRGHF